MYQLILMNRRTLSIVLVAIALSGWARVTAQTIQRTPSEVVREFYKAMHEHRFKDAWSLTIYKSAVADLTAEEMEDLRTDFEDKASQIPDQIGITSEQINGNIATVFVK